MKITIELTPAQAELVRACVGSGRYKSPEEVLGAAVRVFGVAEEERAAFERSLIEASEEADRDGTFTIEDVLEEARAMNEKEKRERAA